MVKVKEADATVQVDAGGDDDARGAQQRSVQSVEVGGKLLLALAERPMPMTLKDLAGRAKLTPSRAHPYLVSFARLGLVEQDEVTGRYALGPAALQMGLACLHQSDAIQSAYRVAEELAHRIDQTVAIAVWANFGPTIVRMIEGKKPLHINMRVGTVMSIFGTATGRAFAAAMPRARVEAALAAPFEDLPESERPRPRDVSRQLKQLADDFKAHGLARAEGHPVPSINAFSAPVYDHEGLPVVVLTALGHEGEFDIDWASPVAQAVRDAAQGLSRRLGYREQLN